MENELPKIDLPEDVLTGVLTDSVILNLYAHFPCRIKAEIVVLCKKGDIDASINLVDYHVSDNSFLVVLPGSIFQVNQIRGDVEIYFAGFSLDFLRSLNPVKSLLDITYTIKHNPVVPLKEEMVELIEDYLNWGFGQKNILALRTGSSLVICIIASFMRSARFTVTVR